MNSKTSVDNSSENQNPKVKDANGPPKGGSESSKNKNPAFKSGKGAPKGVREPKTCTKCNEQVTDIMAH